MFDVSELIERCVRGDDQAQAFFYTEYAQLVERAVTRTLTSVLAGSDGQGVPLRSEVDDICSEVFTRIFTDNCRVLTQLRNPHSIHAWLVTLSRNRTVDYIRKWSGRGAVEVAEARERPISYGQDAHEKAVANEREGVLRMCLECLSPGDRLVLELFFVQGLRYTEIAEVMGLNINTAAARLRRAKEKLRKQLEEARYEHAE